MPTDAELRGLFHDASAPESRIDVATVIRRSKRRRLPQQLGAGSLLTLAVAGIGVASISGLQGLAPRGASDTVADSPMGASESGPVSPADGQAGAPRMDACGIEAPPGYFGQTPLSLVAEFPDANAGGSITGTVIVTNDGTEDFSGWTRSSPSVRVEAGGVVVARNEGATGAIERVELSPGESLRLDGSVDAVTCGQAPTQGTALEAGSYRLVATVEITAESGELTVVSSQATTVTLR